MSPEYGMLITVALLFVPVGLAAYWIARRDQLRQRQNRAPGREAPAGGNLDSDPGFEPDMAVGRETEPEIVKPEEPVITGEGRADKCDSNCRLADAIERMQAAPAFLSKEEWEMFASYTGPVVSGPAGRKQPDKKDVDGSGSE